LRKPSQLLLALTVVIVILAGIGNVRAHNAPAGFDLFETVPSETFFSFIDEFTIPPDFFDPGSDPFQGTIQFMGVPLGSFSGEFTGTADTIVQRQRDAILPGPGIPDTVPIELVALSLHSVSPITVTYNGGCCGESWDVRVRESPSRPSTGTMTITKQHPNGGVFSSEFVVQPLFVFVRADNAQRNLDVGQVPLPPESIEKLTLRAPSVPWVHTCPPPVLQNPLLNPDFCASATDTGKELTREQAALARHGILPANPQPKPVGGTIFSADTVNLLTPYIIATMAVVAIAVGIVYTRRARLGRLVLPGRV